MAKLVKEQSAYKRRSYDMVVSVCSSLYSFTDNGIVRSKLNIFVKIMGSFKFALCLYFLLLAICSIKATPINDLSKGLTEFSTEFYLVNLIMKPLKNTNSIHFTYFLIAMCQRKTRKRHCIAVICIERLSSPVTSI